MRPNLLGGNHGEEESSQESGPQEKGGQKDQALHDEGQMI